MSNGIKDLIKEMVERRMSYAQIGRLFGVSRQRVHQIYRGYKSSSQQRVPTTSIPESWKPTPVLVKKGTNKRKDGLSSTLKGRDYLKELVRSRDNHTCQICLRKWREGERRLDVHHLDEELEGKNGYSYEACKNLVRQITLCHKCHLRLDSVVKKMSKGSMLWRESGKSIKS